MQAFTQWTERNKMGRFCSWYYMNTGIIYFNYVVNGVFESKEIDMPLHELSIKANQKNSRLHQMTKLKSRTNKNREV